MRFDLRLFGRTADGKPCQADISVFAASQGQLQTEAEEAAKTAAWHLQEAGEDWVPEGSSITVERLELLGHGNEPGERKKQ